MKGTKGKFLRRSKGITLVALVVTIVILIILATISVSVVLGEDGLIKQAKDAVKDFKDAQEKEKGDMNLLAQEYANIIAENNNGGSGEGGGTGLPPLKEVAMPSGWNNTKVKAIESEDKKIVPVPNGYVYSNIQGERTVDTGFVIKEGSNGGATEGINEFVWVPVANISDLYDSANNAGQLWDFGYNDTNGPAKNPPVKMTYPTTQNSGYREPDVVTNAAKGSDSTSGTIYDAYPTYLEQVGLTAGSTAKDFKTQLQKEFKEMKDSVEIYGGFYIGRYETGNLSQAKAVVQKGNTDINYQTWYRQYKLNKTIAVNNNVKSSMIWGSQWDATMKWMQSSSNPEVSNFPTNSATQGNYEDNSIEYIENGETKKTTEGTGTRIPTGSAQVTKVNNIYDMAGNVSERTIEAYYTNGRVNRGRCLRSFSEQLSSLFSL